MATGDASAAAGGPVVPSTKDKRLGYDDINALADWVAAHLTNGGHAFDKISGTIATNQFPAKVVTEPKLADKAVSTRALGDKVVGTGQLGDEAVTGAKVADLTITRDHLANTLGDNVTWTLVGSPLRLRTPSGNHRVDVATSGVDVSSTVNVTIEAGPHSITLQPGDGIDIETIADLTMDADGDVKLAGGGDMQITAPGDMDVHSGGLTEIKGGDAILCVGNIGGQDLVYSESIRSNTTSSAANAFVDPSNGVLRRVSSSLRYKVDVVDAEPLATLLDVQPRTWRDRYAAPDDQRRYYGAIAEELDALGLHELVVYDAEGRPEAIAYDRIGVALIPHVRSLHERLDALEARLNTEA